MGAGSARSDPDERAPGLERIRGLIAGRRFDTALDLLRPHLTRDTGEAQAWCLAAQCHLGLAAPGHALHATRAALALDPGSEWAHRLASLALARLRKPTEARAEAEAAVALAPNVWQTHVQRVEVDLGANFVDDETWAAARRALALAPDEPDVHDVLGRVALADGRRREAVASFREALRLDPDDATTRNNLAVAELNRGRSGPAMAHLLAALRLQPTSALLQRNLRVALRFWLALLLGIELIGGLAVVVGTSGHNEVRVDVLGPGRVDVLVAGGSVDTIVLPKPTRVAHVVHVPSGGRPVVLLLLAALLAVVVLVAVISVRRGLGASARRVVGALLRSDPALALAVAGCGLAGLLVLVAACAGLPLGRALILFAAPVAIAAAVAAAVSRRRLERDAAAAGY